jgi:hypothetical protein
MRAIISISAGALTLLFIASAQAQSGIPAGGYVRTQNGFMVPVPTSPRGSPYVANSPSYPYVRPAPGYPNMNSPSLRQQYYNYGNNYGNPTGGWR